MDAIERTIGTPIDFPNPFPNEFGIRTSRGVASYRTFQSIYQAWRLLRLAEVSGRRIVEIGPGLGRTAYYARKFGLSNYSTVDLPLGNIAQACFLSRALGEDAIALPGEQAQAGQIKIETPSWYLASNETFDIAFNANSLTEMALDNANAYAKKNCGEIATVCDDKPRVSMPQGLGPARTKRFIWPALSVLDAEGDM